MDSVNQQLRIQQVAKCRRLADELKAKLRPDEGFTLILFDFGEGGNVSYVSTSERDSMMQALRELVENLDRDENPEGIVGRLSEIEAALETLREPMERWMRAGHPSLDNERERDLARAWAAVREVLGRETARG